MNVCHQLVTGAVFALLATGSAAIAGDVVYSQPYFDNGDNGPFSELEDQQVADEVRLKEEAVLDAVSWHGVYFIIDPWSDGDEVDFRVRFFKDDGAGGPSQFQFRDETVTASVTDTGLVSQGRMVYQFRAPLPNVPLASGTRFISIVEADAGTDTTRYRWLNAEGVMSDMNWIREGGDVGEWEPLEGETRGQSAFTLEGVSDPCGFCACREDLGGNGVVDVEDLLILLGSWGQCPVSAHEGTPPPALGGDPCGVCPCTADINRDGTVSVADLVSLLGAWGGC